MSGVVSAQNAPDNAAAESAKRLIATLKLPESPGAVAKVLEMRRVRPACAIPLINVLPKEARAARVPMPVQKPAPGLPGDIIKPMPACDEAMFQNK